MGRTVEEIAMLSALPPDERIKKEAEKLLKLYTRAHKKRRQLALKMIANAAFMSVKLDDLQHEIAAEGMTEMYTNGANQSGIKKSAKVEVYNSTMKSYMAAIKQLNDMLDDEEAGGGNAFTTF